MAEFVVICNTILRWKEMPEESFMRLREEIVEIYVATGVISADEAMRAWLIYNPADFAPLLEMRAEELGEDSEYGGSFAVAIVDAAGERILGASDGVLAIGPSGKRIDTRKTHRQRYQRIF